MKNETAEEPQGDDDFYAETRLYDEFERRNGRRPALSEKMYFKDFGSWPVPGPRVSTQ